MRQCPAHADAAPSLSITEADDGRVLIHCFAGCATEAVLEALHCSWAHLSRRPWLSPQRHLDVWGRRAFSVFPPVAVRGGHPAASGLRLVARHVYGDGRWVLERWRHPVTGAKSLLWETRRGNVLMPGLFGVPVSALPLYRERETRMAVGAGEPVVVVESESSVDALGAAGSFGTTWAGGASSPNLDRLRMVLAGAHVVLVPDHDEPGLACGRALWAALRCVAEVSWVLPEPGEDARDLLAREGPRALAPRRSS